MTGMQMLLYLPYQYHRCYKSEKTIRWFWEKRLSIPGLEIKGLKYCEPGQGELLRIESNSLISF